MGLGSGRRGMKSPPLLIAVLLACILVLGINYWITSSRCVELQSRVLELEGRMRRAAAERGAVEMKKNEFEEKLVKQKEQIDNIQSLHSSQLQSVNLLYNSEKESLINNVTLKDRRIQILQGQVRDLEVNLENAEKELLELQENQNKKSTFELTQCRNKMNEQMEQCEEKLRRARGKDPNQDLIKSDQSKPTIPNPDVDKKDNNIKAIPQEIEDNAIHDVNKQVEDVKVEPPNSDENGIAGKGILDLSNKNHAPIHEDPKQNKENEVQEDQAQNAPVQNEKNKAEDAPLQNKENKVEGVAVENEDTLEEALDAEKEYNEELKKDVQNKAAQKEAQNVEVEREELLNMEDQSEDKEPNQIGNNDGKDAQNDYNGDEGNVAEPEADKQAQLENNQNLIDRKAMDNKKFVQEGDDNSDPNLKK
ncbi:Golgi membrane 1 isoform X1 [Pelobates cultripes]|uniref:Golgi membrane 1 isoform X1 n=1 Tax=Pelobates cultripes TaxID=61616 RepID=A0AAD1S9W8_PELCU|nr:Golgi membrane 1 isoform X1 [Pelobates cultripes]